VIFLIVIFAFGNLMELFFDNTEDAPPVDLVESTRKKVRSGVHEIEHAKKREDLKRRQHEVALEDMGRKGKSREELAPMAEKLVRCKTTIKSLDRMVGQLERFEQTLIQVKALGTMRKVMKGTTSALKELNGTLNVAKMAELTGKYQTQMDNFYKSTNLLQETVDKATVLSADDQKAVSQEVELTLDRYMINNPSNIPTLDAQLAQIDAKLAALPDPGS
jgi:hypothetical protein